MQSASLATVNSANLGGAKTGTQNSVSGIQKAITNLLKIKEPRKTWGFLVDLFKDSEEIAMTERRAKHRLANTRSYTIEELQVMLQSDHGLEILKVLMADAQPKWWWWAKRVMATGERRRQAAELEQEILQLETSRPPDVTGRRRLKGDLDARTTLNKQFAKQETTLGVLYQDVVRAPDRAVANTKGRGR